MSRLVCLVLRRIQGAYGFFGIPLLLFLLSLLFLLLLPLILLLRIRCGFVRLKLPFDYFYRPRLNIRMCPRILKPATIFFRHNYMRNLHYLRKADDIDSRRLHFSGVSPKPQTPNPTPSTSHTTSSATYSFVYPSSPCGSQIFSSWLELVLQDWRSSFRFTAPVSDAQLKLGA